MCQHTSIPARCCTLALETDNIVQVLLVGESRARARAPIISRAESDIIFNQARNPSSPHLSRTVAAVLECFVPEQ